MAYQHEFEGLYLSDYKMAVKLQQQEVMSSVDTARPADTVGSSDAAEFEGLYQGDYEIAARIQQQEILDAIAAKQSATGSTHLRQDEQPSSRPQPTLQLSANNNSVNSRPLPPIPGSSPVTTVPPNLSVPTTEQAYDRSSTVASAHLSGTPVPLELSALDRTCKFSSESLPDLVPLDKLMPGSMSLLSTNGPSKLLESSVPLQCAPNGRLRLAEPEYIQGFGDVYTKHEVSPSLSSNQDIQKANEHQRSFEDFTTGSPKDSKEEPPVDFDEEEFLNLALQEGFSGLEEEDINELDAHGDALEKWIEGEHAKEIGSNDLNIRMENMRITGSVPGEGEYYSEVKHYSDTRQAESERDSQYEDYETFENVLAAKARIPQNSKHVPSQQQPHTKEDQNRQNKQNEWWNNSITSNPIYYMCDTRQDTGPHQTHYENTQGQINGTHSLLATNRQSYNPGAQATHLPSYDPGAQATHRQSYDPGAQATNRRSYDPAAQAKIRQSYDFGIQNPGAQAAYTNNQSYPGFPNQTNTHTQAPNHQSYDPGARQPYDPGVQSPGAEAAYTNRQSYPGFPNQAQQNPRGTTPKKERKGITQMKNLFHWPTKLNSMRKDKKPQEPMYGNEQGASAPTSKNHGHLGRKSKHHVKLPHTKTKPHKPEHRDFNEGPELRRMPSLQRRRSKVKEARRTIVQDIEDRLLWQLEADEIRGRGLNEDQINTLPSSIFQHTPDGAARVQDGGQKCNICFEEFKVGDLQRNLLCGHTFHLQCADEWMKINAVCPVCKTVIRPQQTANEYEEY